MPTSAPATEVAVESVPTWFLLDHIERDPLLTEEDRAWFRETFDPIS